MKAKRIAIYKHWCLETHIISFEIPGVAPLTFSFIEFGRGKKGIEFVLLSLFSFERLVECRIECLIFKHSTEEEEEDEAVVLVTFIS